MMKLMLVTLFALTSLPIAAIPVEQAIELCRAEQNALQRLNCYDAINATTTSSTPVAASSTKDKAEADFGIESRKTDREVPDQIYFSVKAVKYTARNELIVEFDNGQIWRQNGTDYYKIAAGEQHYIKRGMLSSFFLGNDNNNRTIRVRREQ